MVLGLLSLLAVLLAPGVGPAAGDGSHLQTAADLGPAAPLVIGTVPAVAGFPVTLDDVTVLTDAEGRAHFPTTGEGDLSNRLTLNEAVLPIGGQDVKVSADRIYPSSTAPVIALSLSYRVSFRYADTDGTPMDAGSVGRITVKSITGEVVELGAQESAWLQGSRVVKETGGLLVKDLQWSVQRVEVSGTSVVNAAQQTFMPATQQDVTVQLLFFDVDVHVQDALFGFPTGRAVQLVFPDGTSHRYPLDGDGRVNMPPLPRGDYTLTILGLGPQMPRPVAVSRNLRLDLDFYSWLDIGSVVGSILTLAVALAAIGWRRRRQDVEATSKMPAGPPGRHRTPRAQDGSGVPGEQPTDESTAEPAADVVAGGRGDLTASSNRARP